MTPQLAADIARLDRLTPAELHLEIDLAELAAATGTQTPDDRAYRAELERRTRTTKETETEMNTIIRPTACARVGCACCPTAAYCQSTAVTSATIRFPGETTPATSRACGPCAAALQALQARIDRQA